MATELRKRSQGQTSSEDLPGPNFAATLDTPHDASDDVYHPSGREKKGRGTQIIRGASFIAYFFICCVAYVTVHPAALCESYTPIEPG